MPSSSAQRAAIKTKWLDYETRRNVKVALTRAAIVAAGVSVSDLHDLKIADAVDAVHHCP